MLDTILFDLDGTLLPLELDRFTQVYFTEMGLMFKDLIAPEQLVKYIWAATKEMVNNTEPRTNETIFMECFGRLINGDLRIYQERFDRFYDEGFLKTRIAVSNNSDMANSVKLLREKGYQLVIATNPLFPQKAIHHRIRWAGFEPADFSYITSYEANNFCKPQLQFYQEVLDSIGKQPEQCLMVGNDVQEDLIAGGLGINTCLITNHLIHRTAEPISCSWQGTYHDFFHYASGLQPLRRG